MTKALYNILSLASSRQGKSLLGSNRDTLFLFICLTVFLAGCVTPPRDLPPIGPEFDAQDLVELKTLREVKRARTLAQTGRSIEAEQIFLEVIKRTPNNAALYNDVGTILLGQDRPLDALAYFDKAISLKKRSQGITSAAFDESLAVTLENRAKALYRIGIYEEARETYSELIPIREAQMFDKPAEARENLKASLAQLYRDRAIAELSAGYTGEAICNSRKAVRFNPSAYEVEQHSRLLLSSDSIPSALEFLGERAKRSRAKKEPQSLVFDYGLALFASGRMELSSRTFKRVLTRVDLNKKERLDAQFFESLARAQKETLETGKPLTRFKFFNADFCGINLEKRRPYLPTGLLKRASGFLQINCGSGAGEHLVNNILSKPLIAS